MLGKVSPEDLAEHIFGHTGAPLDSVLQGPAYGEDAAAIDLGDSTLVVSTDPISLAIERVGTLGVYVACNDVAASGGDPSWMTSVIFLPGDVDTGAVLETITGQMDAVARDLGIAIVGGHSEYNPSLERPLVTLTCMGLADRYVPTGGAQPGDRVVLTKGAAIEGTAILASDFDEDLRDAGIDEATIREAESYFAEIGVIEDARVLRDHATGMHDPTEGGLVDGMLELAIASGVGLDIDEGAIPIRDPTREICAAMDVDPLRIFGSGALLATVPAESIPEIEAALEKRGISMATIGTVEDRTEPPLRIEGDEFREPVRDDLYRLWE